MPLTFAASLCLLSPLTAAAQTASNPTYTVTVLTDTTAGVAANCTNQAVSGASPDAQCSLRDALTAAAATNGVSGTTPVTVNFAQSIAAVGNAGTISLGSAGTLTLPSYTTLQGLTAGSGYSLTNLITLDGANTYRVLTVPATAVNAALRNLTIAHGSSGSGGALFNGGSLTISQCTFTANNAVTNGGAILSYGTLALQNSLFVGNTVGTSGYGGAIYANNSSGGTGNSALGTLSVTGSTFTLNTAGIEGAAIYNGLGSVVSVDSSTFTGNAAGGDGAAVYNTNVTGQPMITNSILTGDTGGDECAGVGCNTSALAFSFGGSEQNSGGVYDQGNITLVVKTSSGDVDTVSFGYGQFSTPESIASGFGGTIYNDFYPKLTATAYGATLEIKAGDGVTIDSAVFTNPSLGFTVTPANFKILSGPSNIVGVGKTSANLSALGNHGGPTQTILPLPGSAALCVSKPASATGVDQRGLPRTTAYAGELCLDSGAVQTNYGLAFQQQPTSVNAGVVITPAPTIQLMETGTPQATAGAIITVSSSAGVLSGTQSKATASTGLSLFSDLSVSAAQSADTLIASLAIGGKTVTSQSNPFNVVVAGFTIADNASGAASTSITVNAGATGTGTLKLASMNGFAGSVNLTCSAQGTAPVGTTCTIASPITLTAAGTATAVVTFTSTSRTQTAGFGHLPSHGRLFFVVIEVLLVCILLQMRHVAGDLRKRGMLFLLLLMLGAGLTGCGGSSTSTSTGNQTTTSNPNGTPAGTYNYTVTAVGGGVTASQTVTVTVM